MLAINEILNCRYRILRQIGLGGMGAVYEAEDSIRFGKTVALKEILIDAPTPKQQESLKSAFEDEAKILTKLDHEAFPQVIDYFTETDRQYLVMELVHGDDLHKRLGNSQNIFTQKEVLNFAEQLLDALIYLHNLNPPVIHRDIKPLNLKITSRGRIKLLDFGIAKGSDTQANKTINNQQTFLAASREYSPFEQLLRILEPPFLLTLTAMDGEKIEKALKQSADATTDIYALGATLYHLFTNSLPVGALSRVVEIWTGKADPLPNPRQINASISPEISAWLLKAMEVERENRFASAIEMQEALQEAISSEKLREEATEREKWLNEQEKLKREREAIDKELENIEQARQANQKEIEERKDQSQLEKKWLREAQERADEAEKRLVEHEKQKVVSAEPAVTEPFFNSAPIEKSDDDDFKTVPTFPYSTGSTTSGSLTGGSYLDEINLPEPQKELPKSVFNTERKPKTVRTNKIFWIMSGIIALVLCVGLIAGSIILKRGSYLAATNTNVTTIGLGSPVQNPSIENRIAELSNRIPEAPAGMAYIPGGDFMMGRDDGVVESEKPAHKVTVKPFFMDVYETTNEQYAEFVKATGSKLPENWKNGNYPNGQAKFPVVHINWEDAVTFAKWAGKRLPSEEEWEFAARGTNSYLYPWGNVWIQGLANVKGANSKKFAEVGKFKGVSPFGVYDMIGNAWEWTASDFKAYPNGKLPKDFVKKANLKTIRGGSIEATKEFATTTYRIDWEATGAYTYMRTGFRCAKDIER